ncbi:hypothetical protein G6F57_021874 [Rhizopus arrhizus]|nr:hypothetical protein G6F57_021874 [Rhizopus arrhizus]
MDGASGLERPLGQFALSERQRVAVLGDGARRLDVDDVAAHLRVRGVEVLGRLHDDEPHRLQVHTELRDQVRAHGLGTRGVHDDRHALGAHDGNIAQQRGRARKPCHDGVALERQDFAVQVQRLSGHGRHLAAHAQLDLRAFARFEAKLHGNRVPEGAG